MEIVRSHVNSTVLIIVSLEMKRLFADSHLCRRIHLPERTRLNPLSDAKDFLEALQELKLDLEEVAETRELLRHI